MRMVTVEKGDTLWQIARKNGVSLEALLRANPQIRDPNKIFPGDKVFIPTEEGCDNGGSPQWEEGTTATNEATPMEEMAVNRGAVTVSRSGDTLTGVARRFGVNRDILAAVNGQIGREALNSGAQLYLPGFHHRKSGESLYTIAGRYGVNLEALLAANPAIDDSEDVGDIEKIAIPRRENGDIGIYVVEPGDTLYKIAQRYNIPLSALVTANPEIDDIDRIYPEQILRIPGPHIVTGGQTLAEIAAIYRRDVEELRELNEGLGDGPLVNGSTVRLPERRLGCRQREESGVDYVTARGDSAESVAAMYQVSLGGLLQANPGLERGRLTPNTTLRIPSGFVERVCSTVRSGDSLWRIASRYGLSVEALRRANPGLAGDSVHPGETLAIPIREGRWDRKAEAAPEWAEDFSAFPHEEEASDEEEWEWAEKPALNEWEREPARKEWEPRRERDAAEWAKNEDEREDPDFEEDRGAFEPQSADEWRSR